MSNVHYKLIGFPDYPELPAQGGDMVVSVTDVSLLDDGDLEVTLQYEGEL